MTGLFKGIGQLSSGAMLAMASIMVLVATIGVAQARGFCANIDYLIDQSRAQCVEIIGKPKGDAGDHDVTLTLAGASYCLVRKRSKRSSYHCGWAFPYRAKQAYDTFDALVRDVNACIGQQATLHIDIDLEVDGNMAYELGTYTLSGEAGPLDNGKYVVVWKRTGGEWKWHRDIWNSNKA